MSTLIVEVCAVDKIEPHPNADRLKIVTVKGWQNVVSIDPETGDVPFKVGDRVVFFPPDTVMGPELYNGPTDDPPGLLNIKKYLAMPSYLEGKGRVRATTLRGVASYGTLLPLDSSFPDWPVGMNVQQCFGVTKWEPPAENIDGDSEAENPLFHRYTDIENIGNFPNAFVEGEEVVFLEKLHGRNCRIGYIREGLQASFQYCAGSHSVQRKQIDSKGKLSDFWAPLDEFMKEFFEVLLEIYSVDYTKVMSIVIFGEQIGSGVQDMTYGFEHGRKGFRIFDIAVNKNYIPWERLVEAVDSFSSSYKDWKSIVVPVLYRGPFSMEKVREFTNGPTTAAISDKTGSFKGREGIVIRPYWKEDFACENLNFKRKILKSISADYLARKGGTDAR